MNTNKIDQPVGTKQLILQTTLQLLETQGLTNVNIRKIAAQAGVNIAAVNYHFGSKDQVIYEALEILRNNFEAAFCHLRSSQKPPRERLVGFMTAYCETVFTYPNLVKAFISQNLNSDFQENYSNFVRTEGLALIAQIINEIHPMDDEQLRMKAFQMMSSLVLILLVGKETAPVIGLDFTDKNTLAKYIQLIVPF
jgi:TetR/AcrR family transcriptional regulator, regulator of cefoperazone and chloramphenicol sensitivity